MIFSLHCSHNTEYLGSEYLHRTFNILLPSGFLKSKPNVLSNSNELSIFLRKLFVVFVEF